MTNQPSISLVQQAENEGASVSMPKSPLTSKTLILAVLNILLGITTYLIDPEMVKKYPAEFVAIITIANGVIGAILRIMTVAPLTISPDHNANMRRGMGVILMMIFSAMATSNVLFSQERGIATWPKSDGKKVVVVPAPSVPVPAEKTGEKIVIPPTPAPVVPPKVEVKTDTERVGALSFHERRQRRMTAMSAARFVKKLKDDGQITDDMPRSVKAAITASALVESNVAGENVGLDIDTLLEWLEAIWPIIEMLLKIFAQEAAMVVPWDASTALVTVPSSGYPITAYPMIAA